MYKNNFDRSSTGVNIEFRGYFDNWQSRADFEDNFKVLKWGRHGADLLAYIDWKKITAPEKIGDVFKINKHAKKCDILDLDYFEGETLAEIKDELLNKPIEDWEDFENVLDLKAGFEIIGTTGYCQGDYCKVLIDKKALGQVWGREPDIDSLQEEINHLCWDSPVSASLTINDTEYFYDEHDLDRYDWQREKFAEIVAKESGVAVETLLAILPEHLDYN